MGICLNHTFISMDPCCPYLFISTASQPDKIINIVSRMMATGTIENAECARKELTRLFKTYDKSKRQPRNLVLNLYRDMRRIEAIYQYFPRETKQLMIDGFTKLGMCIAKGIAFERLPCQETLEMMCGRIAKVLELLENDEFVGTQDLEGGKISMMIDRSMQNLPAAERLASSHYQQIEDREEDYRCIRVTLLEEQSELLL